MKKSFGKRKKELIVIFIILAIWILFFSGFSMGKGMTRKNVNGNTQIAKPILEVENGTNLEINNTNNNGIYEFKIRNYNEQNEITQVDLEYYIEILDSIENNGIEIKLLKNDKEIDIKENKTEKFILSKDEKIEEIYKIEITYDKSKNIGMEDIIKQLQIKVHSEQKQEVL